jgi:lactoylglutathione lyase
MKTSFGHVAIRAADIEKTAAFYRDILGMPEAFRMQDPDGDKLGSVHIFVAPSQYIEIFPGGAEKKSTGDRVIGLHHICIEVDNAAAALQEVRSRGAPIDTELKTGYSRCIQFWTHDPDGNAVEFMELPLESLQIQANKRLEKKNDKQF